MACHHIPFLSKLRMWWDRINREVTSSWEIVRPLMMTTIPITFHRRSHRPWFVVYSVYNMPTLETVYHFPMHCTFAECARKGLVTTFQLCPTSDWSGWHWFRCLPVKGPVLPGWDLLTVSKSVPWPVDWIHELSPREEFAYMHTSQHEHSTLLSQSAVRSTDLLTQKISFTDPEIILSWNEKVESVVIRPSSVGILPVNMFDNKSKWIKFVISPNVVGMVPLSLLSYRTRFSIEGIVVPQLDGIVPDTWQQILIQAKLRYK